VFNVCDSSVPDTAINNNLYLTEAFGWVVRQTAGKQMLIYISLFLHIQYPCSELENDMNSAERILHYANAIEQEAPAQRPENKPPPEWPTSGRVEMENVCLRYRPGLPIVLKNINLSIEGGEKIGIIGR
jgi:ABC-type multidrug transport system fused ATPase/permease subunit